MARKPELKTITGGNKQEQKSEKTKRLVVDLPELKHRKLKAAASLEGLTIKQYINILLDDALDD